MGTKLIEINDTEIGLRKLLSILNTTIVTPKYSTSYMDKHSGALEIKMGNCIYVIPEMMVIDDKQRFIVQVKNISLKKCSLSKKKNVIKKYHKGISHLCSKR